eukprot:1161292-Pelagomonas_calceolata.AAC.4
MHTTLALPPDTLASVFITLGKQAKGVWKENEQSHHVNHLLAGRCGMGRIWVASRPASKPGHACIAYQPILQIRSLQTAAQEGMRACVCSCACDMCACVCACVCEHACISIIFSFTMGWRRCTGTRGACAHIHIRTHILRRAGPPPTCTYVGDAKA